MKLNRDNAGLNRKNILINGNMTINQRGFDGDYSGISVDDYGYDRWKKSAGGITQVVEDGNYTYDTVYTISGTNVTTTQLTSPSSGHWSIEVGETASMVQLEEGSVTTDFEYRSIGEELALCQRYYSKSYSPEVAPGTITRSGCIGEEQPRPSSDRTKGTTFNNTMRSTPSVSIYAPDSGNNGYVSQSTLGDLGVTAAQFVGCNGTHSIVIPGGSTIRNVYYHFTADAEL